MSQLYRVFAQPWETCIDLSDAALLSLYNHESYGTTLSVNNGFAVGKKWLNVQVAEWKKSIVEGTLCRAELYADEKYANYHDWLDSILEDVWKGLLYDDVIRISNIGGNTNG